VSPELAAIHKKSKDGGKRKNPPLTFFTKSAPIAVLGWDFGDWVFVFFRGVWEVWLIISSGSNDPREESKNLFVFSS
jgi:hypothetical protein